MVFFFAISATLFTGLIVFNMLIGIMGETMSKFMESFQSDAYIQKLRLIADMYDELSRTFNKEQSKGRFLYLVTLKSQQDLVDDEWEGVVKQVDKSVKNRLTTLTSDLMANIGTLRAE